jgi:glycosyltransferase involved in cell wall biosynthesis
MTILKSSLTVSVITPVLNANFTIDHCINSVLQQNYSEIEHIILDGGSEDGTQEKLARYNLETIKVFNQPKHYIGAAGAVNYGIEMARGDIIVMLCADDWFEKNVIRDVVNVFNEQDVDIVSVGEQVVQYNNKKSQYKKVFCLTSKNNLELNFSNICKGFSVISCRFFSKAFIQKVGYFITTDDGGNYMYSNDKEFLLRSILFEPRHYIILKIGHTTLFHSGSANFNEKPKIKIRLLEEHLYIINKLIAQFSLSTMQEQKLYEWRMQQLMLLAVYGKKLFFLESRSYFKRTQLRKKIVTFSKALYGIFIWKIEILFIQLSLRYQNFFI